MFYVAGVEGKQVAFLLTDDQITSEVFLEGVNNILNSGEIPGMYQVRTAAPYYSTTVCLTQLLFACLDYCLPVSTTVCLPQLLFALEYCLPSTTVCLN